MTKLINKKNKSVFAIFVLIFISILNLNTFATQTQYTPYNQSVQNTPSAALSDPNAIVNQDIISELAPTMDDADIRPDNPIVAVSRKILSILQLVGVAVGLIMLVVIGIQFIVAKDKPQIVDVAINYLFGAFCIFGATGILSVIQQLVREFNSIV